MYNYASHASLLENHWLPLLALAAAIFFASTTVASLARPGLLRQMLAVAQACAISTILLAAWQFDRTHTPGRGAHVISPWGGGGWTTSMPIRLDIAFSATLGLLPLHLHTLRKALVRAPGAIARAVGVASGGASIAALIAVALIAAISPELLIMPSFLALRLARPLLALAAVASLLALGLELRTTRPWDLLVLVPALTSVALNLWCAEGDDVAGRVHIALILGLPGLVLTGLLDLRGERQAEPAGEADKRSPPVGVEGPIQIGRRCRLRAGARKQRISRPGHCARARDRT